MCFSLKDYLPKEYVKSRAIDKKIFAEHKLLANLNELDAKSRYTRNCRELKTYGVTFFLVKVSVGVMKETMSIVLSQ